MNMGSEAVRECVKKIASGGSLTRECKTRCSLRCSALTRGWRAADECRSAMAEIMQGNATDAQVRSSRHAAATQPPVPAAGSR